MLDWNVITHIHARVWQRVFGRSALSLRPLLDFCFCNYLADWRDFLFSRQLEACRFGDADRSGFAVFQTDLLTGTISIQNR